LAEVDFNRDVLPILSDKCFHCHGPDNETREADLRLDVQDDMFGERDGHKIVSPGNSQQSELVQRIRSQDADQRMPPADSKRQLSPAEIDVLTAWVDEGAKWTKHWAFEVPRRAALPSVRQIEWTRNAIDHFVLNRLEVESLAPSPPASRETLIRRVTLDLTGLPPDPDEIDAFLNDDSPNSYERLVELNVIEQCINVIKTAAVQRAYLHHGSPIVHGWVFDLRRGVLRDLEIDGAVALDLCEVPYPTEQCVRDPRCASATPCDLGGSLIHDGHIQQTSTALYDPFQRHGIVVIQAAVDPEAGP